MNELQRQEFKHALKGEDFTRPAQNNKALLFPFALLAAIYTIAKIVEYFTC